jgi:ABC-type multidrug transport system ATPase subunit
LDGLRVSIGSATILRRVDLELGPGEAIGLFGANGAGKTTLLRVIATLIKPAAGTGRVLGVDLSGPERYDIRSRIGLIGHIPALFPELTLEENLRFRARTAGVDVARVAPALHAVGLAGAAGRRADACSHGMQRRAEFAGEIMAQPDLLLLDEPHSALDAEAVGLVESLVSRVLADGGGAILVSHDRERVSAMAGRSLEIKSGVVV